ncbi:hypothetical protein ScPMuIL_013175 [Solemya velum]
MGLLFSYFRKHHSTAEELEDITKKIENLHRFRRQTQEKQKKFIASLILYSILVYIAAALIFYFYYLPDTWKLRLIYSLPLLVFPFLIWGMKKLLHWYFVKRIANNDIKLEELREKKRQILEEVMEKETYKKAKEILEKYDPSRFRQLEVFVKRRVTTTTRVIQSPIRGPRMGRPVVSGALRAPGTTPSTSRPRFPQIQQRQITPNTQNIINGYGRPPGPPLPRPVLPRERKAMDRVLEYLVGDGPQNRYALICRNCHSHNGMALKEEFEYISFRCCYCYAMNPAKKTRVNAPRLEFPSPAHRSTQNSAIPALQGLDDDSETESEEDDVETSTQDTSPENENPVSGIKQEGSDREQSDKGVDSLPQTTDSSMEIDSMGEECRDESVSESPEPGANESGEAASQSADLDLSEINYIDDESANVDTNEGESVSDSKKDS